VLWHVMDNVSDTSVGAEVFSLIILVGF
jgi:hypothetical protein